MTTSVNKRPKESYANKNFIQVWQVLEALEGEAFEPVPVKRIMQRTQLKRDAAMRALTTLELAGLAVKTELGNWTIGRRMIRFAMRIAESETLRKS